MEKPSVSLICPAYYDEDNIGPLVRRGIDVLRRFCSEYEVIVVEDGSPDGTGRAAEDLAKEFPGSVRAIHHNRNRGHGAALKSGVHSAKYPVIAMMDGDGQYDPEDLPALVEMLKDFDLVQGRRTSYPNGLPRLALSRMYNVVARISFGAPFHDLGCAIKVMKKEVAEKALPKGNGIFAQGELVLRAHRAGFRIGEATVVCYPRKGGRSNSMKLKNIIKMFAEMIRLKADWKAEKNGTPSV